MQFLVVVRDLIEVGFGASIESLDLLVLEQLDRGLPLVLLRRIDILLMGGAG